MNILSTKRKTKIDIFLPQNNYHEFYHDGIGILEWFKKHKSTVEKTIFLKKPWN
jgi:hypothetical protein